GIPMVFKATDQLGCSSLDTQLVYISKPSARLTNNIKILRCTTTYVELMHLQQYSYNKYPLKKEWRVNGILQADTGTNISFEAPTDGIYQIALKVTEDQLGCTDTASIFVTVENKKLKAGFRLT